METGKIYAPERIYLPVRGKHIQALGVRASHSFLLDPSVLLDSSYVLTYPQ